MSPPPPTPSVLPIRISPLLPVAGHRKGKRLPRMMPLGVAGGCQISRTEVVLTSGNRMPTGGPGTGGDKGEAGDSECSCCSALRPVQVSRSSVEGGAELHKISWSAAPCLAWCPHTQGLSRRFLPPNGHYLAGTRRTRALVSWSSACVHICTHVRVLRPGHFTPGLTSCHCVAEQLWGRGHAHSEPAPSSSYTSPRNPGILEFPAQMAPSMLPGSARACASGSHVWS